jgi:putative flippase GtrA
VSFKDTVLRLCASRFVRFGVVGGAGFFVNEAALLAAEKMVHAGAHLSWVLAFIPSVTFTWWGNRRITFADKASVGHIGILAEWGRFVATNSFGALANFAVYAVLIDFAPKPLSIPYLALAIGVLAGMLFNFTLSNKLVFRN